MGGNLQGYEQPRNMMQGVGTVLVVRMAQVRRALCN